MKNLILRNVKHKTVGERNNFTAVYVTPQMSVFFFFTSCIRFESSSWYRRNYTSLKLIFDIHKLLIFSEKEKKCRITSIDTLKNIQILSKKKKKRKEIKVNSNATI